MSGPLTRRQVNAAAKAAGRELEELRTMPGVTVYDSIEALERARAARPTAPHRELPPRSAWHPAWRRVFK